MTRSIGVNKAKNLFAPLHRKKDNSTLLRSYLYTYTILRMVQLVQTLKDETT
jgi:hypothetical protein